MLEITPEAVKLSDHQRVAELERLEAGQKPEAGVVPARGLGHLTRPSNLAEADEGAYEDHEGFLDIGIPLVVDGETAEAVEPS